MKKKAKTGKVKTGRKRSATKDLPAKKAGAVKGGLLPAVRTLSSKIADGSVRNLSTNLGTS
jgi:hypothetical protein